MSRAYSGREYNEIVREAHKLLRDHSLNDSITQEITSLLAEAFRAGKRLERMTERPHP